MKRCVDLTLLVLVCFGLPYVPVWADSAASPAATSFVPQKGHRPSNPFYLTGNEKVWSDFPKKPEPGSDIDRSDLKTLLTVQASRTDDQKSEAIKDKHYLVTLMTDVIDPAFETKYPSVFKVLADADQDAYFITTKLKDRNARLRPYEEHPSEVQPLFKTDGYSYPSGHASGMELQARILSTLFRSNGQDALLMKRARDIGDSRVVAGVHYPSDVARGTDLGDLLFTELGATPKFIDALNTAAKADNITSP